MIAVVQRVTEARVDVEGETVGRIQVGFLVLLGVGHGDGQEQAEYLARRIQELRVFEDDRGRMNRDLAQVRGSVLAVPQFTLFAGLKSGRRPDFLGAAPPEQASALFEEFVASLRARSVPVETGRFGATMAVHLTNQGPATFLFDTDQLM